MAELERSDARVDILGVKVSAINMAKCVATIDKWIKTRSRNYVCIRDVHGVIRSQTDEKLRRIHDEAGMVTPDGMPLVWMCRWLGFPSTSRVYGPDLMTLVSELSPERGYRHFYYGGNDGVAEHLRDTLQRKNPGLNVVGTITPPFRPLTPEEDEAIIAEINAARPDIVWVGLSSPKQEHWMAEHIGKLDVPVLIGVGAAFDFLSGMKKQAPRWMQRSGLEWIFRMGTEPRRLGTRYLNIVPKFLVLATAQLVRSKLGRPAMVHKAPTVG